MFSGARYSPQSAISPPSLTALRRAGMAFDFKQSRYKKLSKLLDKFTKDKVISQKVVRKQDTISAVDREHPLLRQAAGERRPGGTGAAARAPAAAARPSKSPAGATIECETVFRVPTSLRPVFESLPGAEDKGSLFSGDQVALALQNYIAAQGMGMGCMIGSLGQCTFGLRHCI